ncbi:MAG: hypothetical protein D6806_07050 [Deltaproteobacteria bacterium]|nr:MAG: hypothetical protein D6806_07050 [Deltaproteobacteria bacterium]
MKRARLLLPALLFMAGTGACGPSEPVRCELWRVCLLGSEKSSCVTAAPERTRLDVELAGYGFYRAYSVDLDSASDPEPVGQFRAWLGGVPLQQVELVDDSPQQQVLTGTLPDGLGRGVYGARVVTPAGCRAELPDAVRIGE